jgi:hypothetical protein
MSQSLDVELEKFGGKNGRENCLGSTQQKEFAGMVLKTQPWEGFLGWLIGGNLCRPPPSWKNLRRTGHVCQQPSSLAAVLGTSLLTFPQICPHFLQAAACQGGPVLLAGWSGDFQGL